MKKILMTLTLVAIASSAYANGFFTNKGAIGVAGTKHDLADNSSTQSLGVGTNQKCIFCHTPHNPAVNVPLWNRNNPATISAYYNSPTLSSAAQAAVINNNRVSSMCMSCHDGVTAYGNIKNTTEGAAWGGGLDDATVAMGASSANLGTDLTNDHPVAFRYDLAADQELAEAKSVVADAGLYGLTTANSKLGGNAFFSDNNVANFGKLMECSSCHKVHDDRVAPFLRMSNDGSQLCLACHVK